MAVVKILDIETAPKLAWVWKFFKENINPNQVMKRGHIMSYAVKDLGKPEITYVENREEDDTEIVLDLIKVLDEADIVIAHNAERFDLPTINMRAVVNGVSPPSPYKVVDTLKSARRHFRFDKNSLEYIADTLGCTGKLKHKNFPGFELWLECLRGNPLAWEEMQTYNVQDVVVLEEVYLKLRPWINNHPNIGVFDEQDVPICPKCGSKHVHYRGFTHTNTQKYRRFRCNSCGGWGRTRLTEYPKDKRQQLIVNAV